MAGRKSSRSFSRNGECMGCELIVLVCTKGNKCRSAYQKNRFVLHTFHLGWTVGNFLRPIIGGGGTQLVAARALAPELQGRSLYCLRPLGRVYRIRAGKA